MSSKGIIIGLIVLLGLGGIAFAIYWLYIRKQGKSCSATSDCGTGNGLSCISGKCTEPKACTTDADCTSQSGTSCQSSLCKPIVDLTCSNTSGCPNGYYCDGTCKLGSKQTCATPTDCEAVGYTCNTTTGTCIIGTTQNCTSNADCTTPGYTCGTNGKCKPPS
jgi:hypothetical protein